MRIEFHIKNQYHHELVHSPCVNTRPVPTHCHKTDLEEIQSRLAINYRVNETGYGFSKVFLN